MKNKSKQTERDSTKKKKKLFISLFKQKICNISTTCEAIDINRGTYYLWREKDEEFNRQCDEAEASLIDLAESQLFKNIRDGKETSLIFFLQNRASDRWKDKREMHHSGKIDIELANKIKQARTRVKNVANKRKSKKYRE